MSEATLHKKEPHVLPDFKAQFIGIEPESEAAPIFIGDFHLDQLPVSALLRSTFLGIGKIRINGKTVGDEVLEPGWQSYHHRLVYRTNEVNDLLVVGRNIIEAEVAAGWYAGRLGFFEQRNIYGTHRAVFAQLDAILEGSWSTVAVSNADWKWTPGATQFADLYDGETYDAREAAAIPCDGESTVEVVDFDLGKLEPRIGPPVRRKEIVAPKRIFRSPEGKVLIDFGRNIVGWVRIRVQGEAGQEIVLRHAEVLENEELGTRPLRTALATDRYILAGGGHEEMWEPSFTYHGFRYVQIDGWPDGEPDVNSVEAVVVYSDMPRVGEFRTSHTGLQQLHRNVIASAEGNFVSIPTDCPQRDERLGWTGDIAVFAPTAAFLFDVDGFLSSWLRDAALEQRPDGSVPNFVPEVPYPDGAEQISPQFGRVHAAVWGDAATMVPFAMYRATGDLEHLRSNLPMMRAWVDGVERLAGPSRLRDTGFQFGDWLDPAAPPEDPASGATEPSLVATAYFAYSARLIAEAALLLGDELAHQHYTTLAAEVASAFRSSFTAEDGRMTSHSQTAYAIVICLGLFESDEQLANAGRHLVELVQAGSHRIATGFVGTPLILDALTKVGAVDDAYKLLLNEECPSWMYAVNMGATTIWERWDSMLPDGTINPGEMTSFNHYAFGAVADWLHSTVAGLSAQDPGYRRIRVAPRPRFPIRDAGASHLTPFGKASVDWRIEADDLVVDALIPEGAIGVFDIEGLDTFERGPGMHSMRFKSESGFESAQYSWASPVLDDSRH